MLTRIRCATYTLQLRTLSCGWFRLAAETLAAADGFPGWVRIGRRPVEVWFYGVALAGSGIR